MALQGTLELENKSYDILDLSYELYKPSDNNNKPSGSPTGGTIHFTIHSPMNRDTVFQYWVCQPAETKEGTFVLPLTNGIEHVTRTLDFQMAHCIRLQESYSSSSSSQMQMRITIITPVMTFNGGLKFDLRARTVERL